MSELAVCSACKSPVSEAASACPKCGHPGPFTVPEKPKPSKFWRALGVLTAVVWIGGMASCVVMCNRANDPEEIKKQTEEKLAAMSPAQRELYNKFGEEPKPYKSRVQMYLEGIAKVPDGVKVESCESAGHNKDGWLLKCSYQMKNVLGVSTRSTKYFVFVHGEVRRHF